MATIYERICKYGSEKNVQHIFTSTFCRTLHWRLYNHFKDTQDFSLITYVQSVEPTGTFTVRNYPEFFTPIIDYVIDAEVKKKLINAEKDRLAIANKAEKLAGRARSKYSTNIADTGPKRKRKRILSGAQKEYSAKPSNPNQ